MAAIAPGPSCADLDRGLDRLAGVVGVEQQGVAGQHSATVRNASSSLGKDWISACGIVPLVGMAKAWAADRNEVLPQPAM